MLPWLLCLLFVSVSVIIERVFRSPALIPVWFWPVAILSRRVGRFFRLRKEHFAGCEGRWIGVSLLSQRPVNFLSDRTLLCVCRVLTLAVVAFLLAFFKGSTLIDA